MAKKKETVIKEIEQESVETVTETITKEKTQEEVTEVKQEENIQIQEITEEINKIEEQSSKVIKFDGEVKLRKFPNLNNSDIIGLATQNIRYKVLSEIVNERGSFYQLSNGYYVESTNPNIVRVK